MKKIFIILSLLFCASIARADDAELIARAEKSLNSFKTAHGMFKQYNADSSVFTGEFWIDKPGKMRFDYAYPNKNFIVSNGSFIFYWDEELQQQTNAPLSYTPAGIVLTEEIKLDGDIVVKGVAVGEGYYAVDVCSKGNEDMGYISLLFDADTDELKQWNINELSGATTIIRLSEAEFDVDIEGKKFKFKDPRDNPFKLN